MRPARDGALRRHACSASGRMVMRTQGDIYISVFFHFLTNLQRSAEVLIAFYLIGFGAIARFSIGQGLRRAARAVTGSVTDEDTCYHT